MATGAWTTMITVRVLRALIHFDSPVQPPQDLHQPCLCPSSAQTKAVSPFPSGAVGCWSPAKGPTAPGPPLG